MPSDLAPIDVSFSQATEAAKLQLQFIAAIADARLKEMKTASLEQHVINQRLTNSTKATSLQQFKIDIGNFRKKQHAIETEAAKITTWGRSLALYLRIEGADSFTRESCFSAYKALANRFPSGPTGWLEREFDEAELADIVSSNSWVAAKGHTTPPIKCCPKNLFQLIEHQARHYAHTTVVAGSTPHSLTALAFREWGKEAAANLTVIQNGLKELQQGTYDIWKPSTLLTLQDSPVT